MLEFSKFVIIRILAKTLNSTTCFGILLLFHCCLKINAGLRSKRDSLVVAASLRRAIVY